MSCYKAQKPSGTNKSLVCLFVFPHCIFFLFSGHFSFKLQLKLGEGQSLQIQPDKRHLMVVSSDHELRLLSMLGWDGGQDVAPSLRPPTWKYSAGLKFVFRPINTQVSCERRPSICLQYWIKPVLVLGWVSVTACPWSLPGLERC